MAESREQTDATWSLGGAALVFDLRGGVALAESNLLLFKVAEAAGAPASTGSQAAAASPRRNSSPLRMIAAAAAAAAGSGRQNPTGVFASRMKCSGKRMSLLDAAKLEGAPTDLTTVKWNPSESSLLLGTLTGSVLLYAFKKRAKVAASTQLGLGLPVDLALSLGYDRGHELAVLDWAVADSEQAGVEGGAQEPCLALMGGQWLLRMDGRRGSSVSGGARPVGVAREMLAQGLVQSAVEVRTIGRHCILHMVAVPYYSLFVSPSVSLYSASSDSGAIAGLVASLQSSTAGGPSASDDKRLLAGGRGMCRIYCQRLLAEHRMESAFTLAHQLADAAILEDIYIHAIRNGAVRLAAVVHGRLVKVLGPDVSPEDRPLSVEDLSALSHLQQEVQAVKVPEQGMGPLDVYIGREG
eukprot:gene1240-1819_t